MSFAFLLFIIGLALLVHACDERTDRIVIHEAAAIALHDGVLEACERRNNLRDGIWATASSLHPEARRDEVRATLNYEDCDTLAKDSVLAFQRRLADKPGTQELLRELTAK